MLGDKIDVKKEIEATLAAKKAEQMIMSLMPAGIILYLQLTSPGFLEVLYGNAFGVCAMSALSGDLRPLLLDGQADCGYPGVEDKLFGRYWLCGYIW